MSPPCGPTAAVGLSTVPTSSVLETPTSTQAKPSLTSPSPTGSNRQLFGSQESVSPTLSSFITATAPNSVSTPKSSKVSEKRSTGARILTSAEHLAMLDEKEKKKAEEAEEKERRKKEREEKRKQKEEEKRLKAEARAKKAEERARKEEEKAKRAEEKAKERALKTEERSKRKTTNKKRAEPATSSEPSCASSCTEKNEQPRQKNANTVLSRSEDLNSGECCVCFDTYDEDVALETGRDWVECACQRWLHEECAEDCVIDPNGQERLCPFCLDVFGH